VSGQRAPAAPQLLPQRLSASACQDLIDCPYRFFGLRMLGLRESARLRAKPDKRDFGSLLHEILLEYHRGAAGDAAAGSIGNAAGEQSAAQRLRRIIDGAFGRRMEQRPALIGYRQRLRSMVAGYIHWEAQALREGWRWQQGEAGFERPLAAAPPAPAMEPAAAPIALYGRIDRIDVRAGGEQRVLDYKTSDAASLRRSLREAGEQVQLLVYGLLLDPPPAQAGYLSLQRPGDPRDPIDGVVTLVPAPQPLAAHMAALADTLADLLARIGRGEPLPANGADSVCRRCELRSLCRYGFTTPPLP
jgi:ATP-dependent helicase/nuclease subunit B